MGKKEIFQSGERFRKESTDFSILQTSIKVCCRIRLKLKLRLRNIETSWNCGSGAELPQPNEINTNNPQPLTAQQLKEIQRTSLFCNEWGFFDYRSTKLRTWKKVLTFEKPPSKLKLFQENIRGFHHSRRAKILAHGLCRNLCFVSFGFLSRYYVLQWINYFIACCVM